MPLRADEQRDLIVDAQRRKIGRLIGQGQGRTLESVPREQIRGRDQSSMRAYGSQNTDPIATLIDRRYNGSAHRGERRIASNPRPATGRKIAPTLIGAAICCNGKLRITRRGVQGKVFLVRALFAPLTSHRAGNESRAPQHPVQQTLARPFIDDRL